MAPRIGTWGVDLDGRDPGTRAQDDFFRHANGAWLERFEIPEDLPSYGSFVELRLRAESDVETILSSLSETGASPATEAYKIATLFADYLDVDAIEARGLDPIAGDLSRIRAASSHEEIAHLLATYARAGVPTPFGYYVTQDAKAPDQYIAHFVQQGLALPNRDYYLACGENPRFRKAVDARRTYLTTIFQLTGDEAPSDAADRVIALETALAEAHWPSAETRDVDRTYNKLTPGELRALAPEFPWSDYLDILGVADQSHLIVTTPSAYAGMAKAFRRTDVATWRAYLLAALISSHADLLPAAFDDAYFRFRSDAVTGARSQRPRNLRGVNLVNAALGEAVGKLYVAHHFSPLARSRMDELVRNVVRAMGVRIDGLDWMSADTKTRAREKLARVHTKIGHPDRWRDYSSLEIVAGDLVGNVRRAREFHYEHNRAKLGREIDRDEWLMSPQTVNAYYNPRLNEIVFPAAILQPPFFDPEADDAVNYGAIGAVIAHEISHGFDDQGRKFDAEGRRTDWWTEEDAARFQARADVLVRQYDGYSPLDGMQVNGKLTLGENIGDLGGIEIAHHAYRLSLDGVPAPPVDGTITGDQRFFLSYAQVWRGKMRDELMAMLISSDPHSPMEFRVNGPVRNVDAWYDAFDVSPDDALYLPPEERVRIW